MTHLITSGMGHGGGGSGGGGGETEDSLGNNLSYPVIFTEGTALTLPGLAETFELQSPYDLNGDGQISAGNWDADSGTGGDQINGYYVFAQKTLGNVWQADSQLISADSDTSTNLFVSTIDWGDSIEGSKPIAVGRPTRIEISFYKNLSTPMPGDVTLAPTMTAYPMQLLANPSSPTEVQGASAASNPLTGTLPNDSILTAESTEASVYAETAQLALQYIVGTPDANDFKWNGDYWVDADSTDSVTIEAPINGLSFGGEITVAGKVVYGLSQGGWRPEKAGTYRATVFFPSTGNLQLGSAQILASSEEESSDTIAVAAAPGGGSDEVSEPSTGAQIDPLHNLTYLDMHVGGDQPPVVSPIIVSKTEDDPSFSINLTSTASDPEGATLIVGNVVIEANNGSAPVALPTGATEVQGANLTINPSAFGFLNAGQKVNIRTTFSVSDGVNLTPSSATVTIEGRDDTTAPNTGGSGGSSNSNDQGQVAGATLPAPANGEAKPSGSEPPSTEASSPDSNGHVKRGRHRILGTDLDDTIAGTSKRETILGKSGDDRLLGKDGQDRLYGHSGNDRLSGGQDNDVLDGGGDVDILIGGGGQDTFKLRLNGSLDLNGRLESAMQPDRIRDFDVRMDRLSLESGITRQMLSFSGSLINVQIGDQILPLAGLAGLNAETLAPQLQFV